MTGPGQVAETLSRLRAKPDLAAALEYFDSLPAVGLAEVTGSWRGSEIPTNHPLDGLLDRYGWYGKRFDGPDDVHPLVFAAPGGARFSVDPRRLPMGLAVRRPGLVRLPGARRLARWARPVLATRRPAARLRMTEHRGVLTATMCYDALPVHDVFRRADAATLIGVMEMRDAAPYVFVLERDGG